MYIKVLLSKVKPELPSKPFSGGLFFLLLFRLRCHVEVHLFHAGYILHFIFPGFAGVHFIPAHRSFCNPPCNAGLCICTCAAVDCIFPAGEWNSIPLEHSSCFIPCFYFPVRAQQFILHRVIII